MKRDDKLYDPETGARLFTLPEAAKYLGYHPYSIYRLVSQGALKHRRIGGKTLVFTEAELDRYRASNEWAARKTATARRPDAELPDLPDEITGTLDVAISTPFAFVPQQTLQLSSWSELPLVKARLDNEYGKRLLGFSMTVQSPDGWTWHIKATAPTLLERALKKVKHAGRSRRARRKDQSTENGHENA